MCARVCVCDGGADRSDRGVVPLKSCRRPLSFEEASEERLRMAGDGEEGGKVQECRTKRRREKEDRREEERGEKSVRRVAKGKD